MLAKRTLNERSVENLSIPFDIPKMLFSTLIDILTVFILPFMSISHIKKYYLIPTTSFKILYFHLK